MMEESKLLDFWPSKESRDSFEGMQNWWKQRRKTYNITLLFTIFVMFLLEYNLTTHRRAYWVFYLKDVILCVIFANFGYTFGWIIESIYKNLTDKFFTPKTADMFYKTGALFSVIIVILTGIYSILVYRNTLLNL
jgi:hypothetical protein